MLAKCVLAMSAGIEDDSSMVGGNNQVNDNVKWATLRVVGDPIFGLKLKVICGAGETSNNGKEEEDVVKGITYVVVEVGLAAFGETTSKKVVTVRITGIGAEGTRMRWSRVKEG